jgi:hypothetical protein
MHILEVQCVACDNFMEMYAIYPCFKKFWTFLQQTIVNKQTTFLDYTLDEGWLYKINQLCVPE